MSKVLLVLVLTLVWRVGIAQGNQLNQPKQLELKPKLNSDPFNPFNNFKRLHLSAPKPNAIVPVHPTMPVLKSTLNKRMVGSASAETDLYVIEPYNMPCITPSKIYLSNMPVVGLKPPYLPTLAEK